MHRCGAFSAASSGARLYARECTCTPLFPSPPPRLKSSRDQKFGRRIRYRGVFGHVRLPSDETGTGFDSSSSRFSRQILVISIRSSFQTRTNSKMKIKKGRFYSCASIFGIGEGNRGNGTFRFGVTYTVATSRCPTAFLLFTRLLYAISRCTYSIRRATLFPSCSFLSVPSVGRLPVSRG